MKRLIVTIMVLVVMLAVSACGKTDSPTSTAESINEIEVTESTETPEVNTAGYDTSYFDNLGIKDYGTVTDSEFIRFVESNNSYVYIYELNPVNNVQYAYYLTDNGWTMETSKEGNAIMNVYYKDGKSFAELLDVEQNEAWIMFMD